MPITIAIERYFDVKRLRGRPVDFWLRVVAATLCGMVAAELLGGFGPWTSLRYAGYNIIQKLHPRGATYAKKTAVVLIDDEDYWKGDLARRSPLKRSYLASLIRRIADEQPNVIGLDVDLSSQVPDGSLRWHQDYECETAGLIGTLMEVSKRVPIVVAKNVYLDEDHGTFVAESDVFDGRLTSRLKAGYVLLPRDIRQIAPIIKDDHNRDLDSFAVAVARFADSDSVTRIDEDGAESSPFAWFLGKDGFRKRWITSSELARRPLGSLEALKGSAVIIGGAWSERGYGRGEAVDLHATPIGEIPGAALLANYVESLLTEGTTPSLGHFGTRLIEFLFGIALACVFVCAVGRWKGWLVGAMLLVATLLSVLFYQNIGVFIDAVPLVAVLIAHAVYEQVLDWKAEAHEHRTHCLAHAMAPQAKGETPAPQAKGDTPAPPLVDATLRPQ